MFGLTTTRSLRAAEQAHAAAFSAQFRQTIRSVNAHSATRADLAAANHALTEVCSGIITERLQAARDHEHYRHRLTRALQAVARWRTEAGRARRETRLLAEQLLTATSGENTAARRALGLDVDPWRAAVDALNTLVDAGARPYAWNDGIESGIGNERIEYAAGRWRLVHDETSQRADAP
ncbi:hypothetical protein GCM10011583_11610 [Streptomyces camponoticapitis]|uniref:Uncharacterized protein n=1 Tax=Streptomyces camponoticapitis TaxID=1616125 RepID=A0ABQ2E255_9ACTN|nr:hypothetical protein [Streptomyces camponoticapitis]GGJ81835.1 hypothetical protein GCM10011583_11610 [Streptomyces camponoticapitis]